jgi:hypothetical protein
MSLSEGFGLLSIRWAWRVPSTVSRPPGLVPARISPETFSGYWIAGRWATKPPIDQPSMSARSTSIASMKPAVTRASESKEAPRRGSTYPRVVEEDQAMLPGEEPQERGVHAAIVDPVPISIRSGGPPPRS